MNTIKNISPFTEIQRKALAALTLVILLTNSQVASAAYVAPVTQAEPTTMTAIQPETETVPVIEPTVQEVLLNVCEANGYGVDCAKTLLGMLWTESSNQSTVIGDNGKARGYFQIHYKLHKITSACAEDLVCAANWTINYLERNSYPKYVNYAIQCHNGCNANNGYVNKVQRYAKQFWNQPLAVTQAAPIELAMK
ncbi:hypothetical protein M0Q28_03640 [Patescibacteria group bacterium]|jgi:hypothetical protein|nr:hypothetical protein [Patescibacteria group bacterium]